MFCYSFSSCRAELWSNSSDLARAKGYYDGENIVLVAGLPNRWGFNINFQTPTIALSTQTLISRAGRVDMPIKRFTNFIPILGWKNLNLEAIFSPSYGSEKWKDNLSSWCLYVFDLWTTIWNFSHDKQQERRSFNHSCTSGGPFFHSGPKVKELTQTFSFAKLRGDPYELSSYSKDFDAL